MNRVSENYFLKMIYLLQVAHDEGLWATRNITGHILFCVRVIQQRFVLLVSIIVMTYEDLETELTDDFAKYDRSIQYFDRSKRRFDLSACVLGTDLGYDCESFAGVSTHLVFWLHLYI